MKNPENLKLDLEKASVSVEVTRETLVARVQSALHGTSVKLMLTYQGYEGVDGLKQVADSAAPGWDILPGVTCAEAMKKMRCIFWSFLI